MLKLNVEGKGLCRDEKKGNSVKLKESCEKGYIFPTGGSSNRSISHQRWQR
jgi:hypothetical protein